MVEDKSNGETDYINSKYFEATVRLFNQAGMDFVDGCETRVYKRNKGFFDFLYGIVTRRKKLPRGFCFSCQGSNDISERFKRVSFHEGNGVGSSYEVHHDCLFVPLERYSRYVKEILDYDKVIVLTDKVDD